ncbi:MAG: hypothetical protein AAFV26_03420, partial [Pseudomonadota bacterium]
MMHMSGLNRLRIVGTAAFLVAALTVSAPTVSAQTADITPETTPTPGSETAAGSAPRLPDFSFDTVVQSARVLSEQAYAAPQQVGAEWFPNSYDEYRKVRMR